MNKKYFDEGAPVTETISAGFRRRQASTVSSATKGKTEQ